MALPPVKVQLAITKEQTKHNIEANLKQLPNFFSQMFYPNGFEAIIVSGGPSLEKYVTELNLKERMESPDRGFVLFCVKHALPRLLEMGIEPDFCVILDGRPLNDDSTHGVNRKSLFKKIPEKTIFLVASMSHPDYGKYLMDQGARVLGWHTQVDGLNDYDIREPIITGGTSSGTRCIAIAHALGCRQQTLVSFDSCIKDPTPEQLQEKDRKGRQKYIPVDLSIKNYQLTDDQQKLLEQLGQTFGEGTNIGYKGEVIKRFYSTGELLAQAQDFEKIFASPTFDVEYKVYDDGLVSHMFTHGTVVTRGYSFVEYFKNIVPRKSHAEVPKRTVS